MTVKNVQDVMLAAVAVSGMKGTDIPDANTPEVPSLVTGAAPAEEVAAANAPEEQWAEEQAQTQHEPLSEEQTAFITEQLNEIMRNINVDLQFQYHKEVNFMSVRMLDKKTGEVLREVPPEAMVEHMIKVHDWIGAFLDKTA
jgi:flagellin protein